MTRFHVFETCGGGYSPDASYSYASETVARDHLADWQDSWRDWLTVTDPVDPSETYVMRGSPSHVYAALDGGLGFFRNCTIEPCDDETCELCAEALAEEGE